MTVDAARQLVLAGRQVPDPWDRIRRYCGLTWSGGSPETWAFHYYDAYCDARPTSANRVEAGDVLAAGALHPGITRADLAFFHDSAPALQAWIARLPGAAGLPDINDAVMDHLVGLRDWAGAVHLGLLTKVLHRKRPQLIPLVDREVLDWYRPITGERSASGAWPGLLDAMRADVTANHAELVRMGDALMAATAVRVSALRLIDIALWMGSAR